MTNILEIKGLHVEVEGKKIIKGLDLAVPPGETHAIMGPNGSGKSTLSSCIMGHPKYDVTAGDILFEGRSILGDPTEVRARKGIFLCFQYPSAIPGVTLNNLLRTVLKNVRGKDTPLRELRKETKEAMASLKMDESFSRRHVNDGLSGGEKKRSEILQMSLMRPKISILDEVDSGLDIDALRIIADNIENSRSPDASRLVITHYQRILSLLTLDRVHVMVDGRIVKSGGREVAQTLEDEGYAALIEGALP